MIAASKTHVLVVEDFAPMIRIYRHFLKQIGVYDVDAAGSGAEALDMMSARTYGLIISDWHMEPMTGFQLLRKARTSQAHADVPFIIATIESRADYIKAARAAGASDYLFKPFRVACLRESILNVCPAIAATLEGQATQPSDRWLSEIAERRHHVVPRPAGELPLEEPYAGLGPV